ncbi:MAG: hypothetical protein IKC19_01680 [Bacteroidales bacterium]|nr:hypothetical protein [Bacteroidales bacterium]
MDRTENLEQFDVQREFELLAVQGAMHRMANTDRRRWQRFNTLWFALISLLLLVLLASATMSVARTPYSFIACADGPDNTDSEVLTIANNLFV